MGWRGNQRHRKWGRGAVALTVLMAAALVPVGGAAALSASGERPKVLRFANTDLVGLEELQREFGRFQAALQDTLGMPVQLFPVPNRTAVAVALEAGQVDLVLTGPAEYVAIRTMTRVMPVLGLTRPGYRSVIVTHADSGIRTLQDLRGKRIALQMVGSTSRHLGPTVMLMEEELRPGRDVQVLFLGGGWLEAFANGEVDAAGMSYIDYQRLVQRFGPNRFRLVKVGPDLPNDIFIARAGLDPGFVDEIRRRFMANEAVLLRALITEGENAKYAASRFAPADDAAYEPIVKAYEAIGIYDYSNYRR